MNVNQNSKKLLKWILILENQISPQLKKLLKILKESLTTQRKMLPEELNFSTQKPKEEMKIICLLMNLLKCSLNMSPVSHKFEQIIHFLIILSNQQIYNFFFFKFKNII